LNATNDTTKEQPETIEKANVAIENLQEQTVRTEQRATKMEISYRDALVNGSKRQTPQTCLHPSKRNYVTDSTSAHAKS